jgi:uncharacterized protein
MKQLLFIFLAGVGSNSLAINPEREYRFTPTMRGLSYEEYQVKTPDNYSINVWEYALPDSVKGDRIVVIVGTDAGNMGYTIWQAKAFMMQGIRVVSFDYRGFGKSSDFPINRDFLYHPEFAIDLDSVLKSVRKKYATHKIGLYALSMGSYVSLLRKEKIEFYIAEGFYHNPQKVVARIKVNKNQNVLLPASAKSVRKLTPKIPILIFCADQDKTTTTEDAKEFAIKNEVSILEFKGEHLYGMSVMTRDEPGDIYSEKIAEFLAAKKI